jgi:hypothetical protein
VSEKNVAIFFSNFSEQKAQECQHDLLRVQSRLALVIDGVIYTLFAKATPVAWFRSMRGSRSLTRNSYVLCEMRAEDEETFEHRACGRTSRFG